MKKLRKFIQPFVTCLLSLFFISVIAWAGSTNFDSVVVTPNAVDDTYGFRLNNSSGTRLFSVDASGNTYVSGTLTVSNTRSIPLPLLGFMLQYDASTASPVSTRITEATSAYVAFANSSPHIRLVNGYTSPIVVTFRVPDDYSSGGYFRLMANQSGTTTACTVDFDVYVNTAGSTMDASATNETPMALTYAGTTPSGVSLTSTSLAALVSGGQWVTVRIWRGSTTGTDDLQVKSVTFVYTATR